MITTANKWLKKVKKTHPVIVINPELCGLTGKEEADVIEILYAADGDVF